MKQTEKQTLGEKTAQNLLEMIQQKEYTPGDKLPTEAELVETLGVGRNTVREALRILMSRNIVTIRQGSGTYIAASPGMVEDPLGFTFIGNKQKLINDLLEVRFLLEPSIAAMAATHADENDIKKITAQVIPIFSNISSVLFARRPFPSANVKYPILRSSYI